MLPVAVSGLHDQHVGSLVFLRPGVHHLAGRNFAVAHAANVAGEEQPAAAAVRLQRDFRHAGTQNVRGMHEAKRQLGAQLRGLRRPRPA